MENAVIERRLKSLADAHERQRKLKGDLTKIHTQAIERQMLNHDLRKKEEQQEKKFARVQMDKQAELLRNRNEQVKNLRMIEQ